MKTARALRSRFKFAINIRIGTRFAAAIIADTKYFLGMFMKFTRPRQIPCELLCIQYLLFLVAHPILLSRATQPVSPSPGQQKSYVVTAAVE